jgi:hypothetical protein
MPATPSEALARHRRALLKRRHVVLTGVGYKVSHGQRTGQVAIVAGVTEKVPLASLSPQDVVPRQLDGVPTDVIATGSIQALALRTDRHRPAPGGVSIGHYRITAGTLGCLVTRAGATLILSNNHVLANSNKAKRGDPILQPGPIDGGDRRAPLARLEAWVPIRFRSRLRWLEELRDRIPSLARVNLVDAALARPLSPGLVSPEILGLGRITGVGTAELGTPVQKSGRTTGVTSGTIQLIDVTVDVEYDRGRVARFTDQLLTDMHSEGGDSGSVVLNSAHRIVGLLFAGSDTVTILNPIQHVVAGLRLEGVGAMMMKHVTA